MTLDLTQRADVLLLIFGCLDWKDRARCALVCKEWREQARSPSLWQTLDLRNSQRPRPALQALSRIPHLQASGTRPPAALHSFFEAHCAWLEAVNLEFAAGVEDEDLERLQGFSLKRLNLNGCQRHAPSMLTPGAISRLVANCTRLEALSLYWNLRVDDAVLRTLGARCPALHTLSVSGCKAFTDAGVQALARGCPGLVDLDLTRCLLLRRPSFEALAAHCRQLEVLRLYARVQVDDKDLTCIARLGKLRVLDICGTQEATDEGIQALAAGCPRLQWLNLTWVTKVGDASLVPLARSCPGLRWLSLHGLLGVTDATITALAECCRGTLTTLDVNGCRNIQRRSREELLRALPKLTCFRVHS